VTEILTQMCHQFIGTGVTITMPSAGITFGSGISLDKPTSKAITHN